MSDLSANLQIPYLAGAQAQKHVTVNEAMRKLDALVQLSVVSATTAAQPGSPVDGAVYILPAGKTGAAWGGMANGALAYWRDGAWEQITPREGWIAFIKDSNLLAAFDGAAWTQAAIRTGLGLGTAALANTGTSGSVVPLLDQSNTFSGSSNVFETITLKGGSLIPSAAGGFAPGSAGANTFLFSDGVYYFDNYEGGGFEWRGAGYGLILRAKAGGNVTGQPLVPSSDGGLNLGSASYRFGTVFAATGAISTSDAREKTPLAPVPAGVVRAVRRVLAQIGVFQWRESIARKGEAGARLHVGVTAQAVRDAFLAEGEDPARWGLFCADAAVEEVIVEPATFDVDGRMVAPERRETRPLLDAEGLPLVRLGVRADQLTWLALASLAAT